MKAALVLLTVSLAFPAGADIVLSVRDAVTGVGLQATVALKAAGDAPSDLAVDGRGRLPAPGGPVRISVSAPGRLPLAASFDPGEGQDLAVTFWLDPIGAPAPEPALPGQLCIAGWVVDAGTLRPLEGVDTEAGASGPDGRFRFCLPVPRPWDEEALPTASVLFRKPGYADLSVDGILLREGTVVLRLEMEPGEGTRRAQDLHRFLLPQEGVDGEALEGDDGAPAVLVPSTLEGLPVPLAAVIDPPDTVKVGMSCSCTTCSSVDVVSLETYVKRGLNDEWIASWGQHALRSGAVAYRSYGSYYVLHPLNANYDICSTACCQVNDADTATATNTAVDRTAGILLQRSGAILRSEYSAENNAWDDPDDGFPCTNADLSCGDGEAGSPSTSWPCLSDPVCAGHGCFGHGRGMCQWGTQRWASTQGKLWNWIVNHYYNDNGAGSGYRTGTMTSPLALAAASPSPSTVAAGETFTINLSALNYAETDHAHAMIGASLYSPSSGYISDPAHDAKVTLHPGSNAVSRLFMVPSGTSAGGYDLITALWLDTDEDGAITAADLMLTSRTDAGAVTVTAPSGGTCADPYPVGAFPYTDTRTTVGGAAVLSATNCRSTRSLTGPERVYRFTTLQPGTLSASLSSREDLDVLLLRACGTYDCEAWGDTGFTRDNLPPGTYFVVVDTAGTAGTYTLNLAFAAGDTLPPEAVDDLRLSKSGGSVLLAWSAVARDIAGQPQAADHYRILRGATPDVLPPIASIPDTSHLDAVLADGLNWFYRVQAVDAWGNGAAPCRSAVVDDPQAAFTGSWSAASAQPDQYGPSHRTAASNGSGSTTAIFTPALTCARPHRVYSWHPAAPDRSPAVPVTVQTASGPSALSVDQTADGGKWTVRGEFDVVPGAASARISDAASGGTVVIADAFRFAPVPKTEFLLDEQQSARTGNWNWGGSTGGWEEDYLYISESAAAGAEYRPVLEVPGPYAIYTWYREGTNRSTAVPYTITTAAGDTVVSVNQQTNGRQWFLLGTFDLHPDSARVRIGTPGSGSQVVIADAVRFVKQ